MERQPPPPDEPERARTPEALPEELLVSAIESPFHEEHGFNWSSMYVLDCWTPVLGPAASLLYRRLARDMPNRFEPPLALDTLDVSRSLGLGEGTGASSRLAKALWRLRYYDFVRDDDGVLMVRADVDCLRTNVALKLGTFVWNRHQQMCQARNDPYITARGLTGATNDNRKQEHAKWNY
jgi:hypothetical protein